MIAPQHRKLSDRIQKERDCKRSSARVYSSNLHRIHREFLSDTKYSQDLKWLKENSKRLLVKLKKVDNLNTQRNLLAAALVERRVSCWCFSKCLHCLHLYQA